MHTRILLIFWLAFIQIACAYQSADTKIAEFHSSVNPLPANRESCYSGALNNADIFVTKLEE